MGSQESDGFLSCRPGPQTHCPALHTWGLDCLQLRVCSQSHAFLPVPGVFLHVVPLVSLITFFLSRNQAAHHPSGRIAISVIPPVAWSPVLSGDTRNRLQKEPFIVPQWWGLQLCGSYSPTSHVAPVTDVYRAPVLRQALSWSTVGREGTTETDRKACLPGACILGDRQDTTHGTRGRRW